MASNYRFAKYGSSKCVRLDTVHHSGTNWCYIMVHCSGTPGVLHVGYPEVFTVNMVHCNGTK